jgi:hypothetical protein
LKCRLACGVLALCATLGAADNKTTPADKKTAATAKKPATKDAPAATNPQDLLWPLPPDPPRVRWVTQYTDMAKIRAQAVKKSSWVEKVTGTKTTDEKFELRKPYGITTDKHGRIYAADTELKFVFVIDPVNKTVERREGTTRAPLSLPVGVALDAEERLFVSDADLHWIVCFTESGKPLASFGAASF